MMGIMRGNVYGFLTIASRNWQLFQFPDAIPSQRINNRGGPIDRP